MSDDFVFEMQKRSSRKKFSRKHLQKSATLMLPSPSSSEMAAEVIAATRPRREKNATRISNANGTPPSAQRPLPTQESPSEAAPPKAADAVAATDSDMISPDDVDDDALLAPTQPTREVRWTGTLLSANLAC